MSKVLEWVKSNLVIVLLGVAIVAVLILAPLLASSLNESVATEAKNRAAKMSQLDSLARTSMKLDVPGRETIEVTTVANPKLLAQYEKFATSLREDAAAVRKLAIEHNRKGRGVLIPRLFPRMPPPERDTLPTEFYRTLITAYENLLRSVRAGGPPSASEVTETLLNRESQFIMNNFRKQQRSDLDAQEVKDLDNELSRARLAAYGEAASSMAMYATLANLDVPAYPANRLPTMAEMFDWQWRFWIQDDVLRALGEANGDSTSVVMSPVKRVLSLAILNGLPAGAGGGGGGGPSLGGSGAIGGRRGFGGAAESGGGGPAPDEEPEADGPVTINASAEAALDYRVSFTGRTTNALYDVRNVQLQIVVSAERLPEVLNAISRRNFMTVLNVDLQPADAFAAAAEGYIYGTEPVVRATLLIETVWLREWTVAFMPARVRAMLGIGASSTEGGAGDGGL